MDKQTGFCANPEGARIAYATLEHGVFIGDPTDKVGKTVLDFLHRHSKAHTKN